MNIKGKTVLAAFAALAFFSPAAFSAPPDSSAFGERDSGYVEAAVFPLRNIRATTKEFVEGVWEYDLLHSSRTTISLGMEGGRFSKIAGALKKYSEKADREAEEKRAKMIADAESELAERKKYDEHPTFYPYEWNDDILVRRADSVALSFLESSYSYYGGVHGDFGVSGKNYDVATGKELALSDVFTDLNELAGAIETQLRRDYPDASFMASGGVGMADMVEQLTGSGSLIWALDPRGASFYFNPYVIGAYSEGIFTASILFDEYPGLFREKYRRGATEYCMELHQNLPVRTVFYDGRGAAVEVEGDADGVKIRFGGEELVDALPCSVYDIRPVLVSLSDGRRYIYADVSTFPKEDHYEIRVYDLTGDAPSLAGVTYMTRLAISPNNPAIKKWDAITDPNDFWLNATDITGSYARSELEPVICRESQSDSSYGGSFHTGARLRCRVGADGLPEVFEVEGAVG